MARLTLTFLGPFQVTLDGQMVTGFVSNKVRALLAYLAVESNRPHSRESLCGLLWPDWPQSSALSSLRNCLADLRKNIRDQTADPSFLLITRENIQFNRSSDFSLDLEEFERLSQSDNHSQIDPLKKAISLYRGSFLEGFSLPDSNPFEEWLEAERERVNRQMQAHLMRLADAFEMQDEYEQALVYAHRQLTMEPWLEEAHQRVMRLLARSGQRSAALAQFDTCRNMLEKELGVQPGAETLQLYETIRDGKLETSHTFSLSLSKAPTGTVTFLYTDIEGSTELLERLRERYAVLLGEQRDLLQASFTRWNGHEIDAQDDFSFIAFARASDAVACAVEAQRAVASYAWPEGVCIRLRMGIHTGESIVTRTSYYGMDIYRAARIAAIGYGGQVLVSQITRDLIEQELPDCTCLRDLGIHKLKDIRYPQHIYQLDIQGLKNDFPALLSASEAEEPPAPGEPPFKGLQFFEEADAERFFGRSQVTARLLETICETPFLAVIGASGSGKSSVIRAGLIPALKRSNIPWQIHLLTPGVHPLEALAIQLTRGLESVTAATTLIDDMAQDHRSLHLFLKKNHPVRPRPERREQFVDGKTLLIIDQFEELFTLCRGEGERRAFVENLLYETHTGDRPAHLLIALRADFYAHLAQYEQLRRAVAGCQEYLGAMSAEELRQAIVEPARLGGWEYSPGLVELMLHEIGADAGSQPEPGALPLLSHALLETWKHRRGHRMNLKAYVESGGVRRAIARTAESLYTQELSPQQQEIARNIFLRLTELGEGTQDTRRRATLNELYPPPQYGNSQDVEEVLNKLADARLVITEEGTAEVAHEALIREWPTLREWLTQNREGLRNLHHLAQAAQEWEAMERDPGMLYRGSRLAQVLEWAQENTRQLNVQEQAFLEASREAAYREQVEQEKQRQRELAAAQKLAEAESLRAEEQTQAAYRLRQRAVYLSLALAAAFILIIVAIVFARQSNTNLGAAQIASTQANIERVTAESASNHAISEAHTRATAEAKAVQQAELARVREWTTIAANNLTIDPELSILLALQAVKTRDIPETENALHQAVRAFRLRDTLYVGKHLYAVAFHPSGKSFATASPDGFIQVWKMADNGLKIDPSPVLTITNPVDYYAYSSYNLLFSPDGRQLAFVSTGYTAKIWDATSGELLHTLRGHTSYVTSLAFSPDGKLLATASADHTVDVWDAQTGQLLQTLFGFQEAVQVVIFNHDGKYLAAGGNEGLVQVWNKREVTSPITGENLYSLSFSIQEKMGGYRIQAMDFSPDGNRLALSISWGINIYDISTASAATPAKLLQSNTTDEYYISGLFYSPDGAHLVSGSLDGKVRIWDATTGQMLFTVTGSMNDFANFTVSRDGMRLLTAHVNDTIKVWDLSNAGNQEWLVTPDVGLCAGLSADGKRFITATGSKQQQQLHLWELAPSGYRELTHYALAPGPDPCHSVGNPDLTQVVEIDQENFTVYVLDLNTGQAKSFNVRKTDSSPGHSMKVTAMGMSSDSTRLATASDDGQVILWDLSTGRPLFVLKGHTRSLYAYGMAFSPDNSLLATASYDGTVRIWDIKTGKQLHRLPGYNQDIVRAAFSPDGKRLLATGEGNTVKLWDVQTGQEILSLPAFSAPISYLAISPDGRYLGTSSLDGIVRLWNAVTGQAELTFPGFGFGFTSDAKHLITIPMNGSGSGYFLDINDLVDLARSRLTRTWTLPECQKYLHMDTCPVD